MEEETMKQCKSYATAIRTIYGIFAVIIAIALMIISNDLNNWWYFVGGCLIYSLWIVLALAYAAHLDAVAEQIAQNERIIELLSEKPQTSPTTTQKVSTPTAEKAPVVQREKVRAADSPVAVAPSDDNGYIVCPVCNTRQRSNRTKCLECGSVFEK